MTENTTETLKRLAPQFVALDEAEKKAEKGPWIQGGCSGRMITRPDGYYGDGFLADVDLKTNSDLIVEARNQTRPLLDAHAKALRDLEKAKEVLAFYGWQHEDEDAGMWNERMENEWGDKADILLKELGE